MGWHLRTICRSPPKKTDIIMIDVFLRRCQSGDDIDSGGTGENQLAAGTGLEEAAADGFDHVGP
jgi:hypothetical protein